MRASIAELKTTLWQNNATSLGKKPKSEDDTVTALVRLNLTLAVKLAELQTYKRSVFMYLSWVKR